MSVADLASLSGFSTGHFQRLFRREFGMTPGQFLRHERLERFADRLRQGHSVTEAAIDAGLGSSSRAHQAARDSLGMTPSATRRGAAGERIEFGTIDCRLGRVLVAATQRGLCAVLIDDRDAALTAELRRRFPAAKLIEAGPQFQDTLQSVIRIVDGERRCEADLPLDLRGTLFQRKVWAALQQIPAGRTVTYGELARRVGLPGGARAVASACGANPAAVIVPCHRVVAANGGLGGYRWGVERKAALLERERMA